MTQVSNDPRWWPIINVARFYSYFVVVSLTVVVYDWALTFGQEIELIWRQRWSLMTVLYLSVRYIGMPYTVFNVLDNVPSVSMTDAGCNNMFFATNVTNVVINAMLGVIMITRLHAMYQRSREMLIFLIVIFLAVNTACGVMTAMGLKNIVGEELILSSTYECTYDYVGDVELLIRIVWILNTVWEALALCLAVWIAVAHFRDLRRLRPSTGSTIEDIITVLIKSHALYFASFAAVACFQLGLLSLADSYSVGTETYYGVLQIFTVVQMFVLGPRLILSIREYHAKLVVDSDSGTGMTSIAFQEHVHMSTGSDM